MKANADIADILSNQGRFRLLYEKYYPGLVVYAREFMIGRAEAEDLVQDIFVALWEKKNSPVIESIGTYLFRATRNGCLNYLSHLKVRTKYQNVVLKEQKPLDAAEEGFYVVAELEGALKAAIGKMPAQRQRVFTMNRFEDKSAAEISEELMLSVRTVEKHLQLALGALREHFAAPTIK